MITGKCLCGKVRYEINARLGPIVYCHCSMCRRATGSAFATNASVRANEFRVVAGSELISEYESSPSNIRAFCSRCGSPLYCRWFGLFRIRFGTVDGDPGECPVAHVWAVPRRRGTRSRTHSSSLRKRRPTGMQHRLLGIDPVPMTIFEPVS